MSQRDERVGILPSSAYTTVVLQTSIHVPRKIRAYSSGEDCLPVVRVFVNTCMIGDGLNCYFNIYQFGIFLQVSFELFQSAHDAPAHLCWLHLRLSCDTLMESKARELHRVAATPQQSGNSDMRHGERLKKYFICSD